MADVVTDQIKAGLGELPGCLLLSLAENVAVPA
ncbi:hypothetical protein CUJ84_pRLN3000414 (plasmid) [Rhizobium leguminosarum]|uniref:Uncharacterized protein n=1 Tax=Rhizobium leguminosarum TaxID=384 RepID=A0A2K9ZH22_RHILE|nr:hypothetical protein CUJ84_pRLN3000414 [Rhizobium leguminosarum]